MARIIIFLLIVLSIIAVVYLLSKFGKKLLNQRSEAKRLKAEAEKQKLAFDRCKELLPLLTYDDDLAYLVKEGLVKYLESKDTKALEKKRVELETAYGEIDDIPIENHLQMKNR